MADGTTTTPATPSAPAEVSVASVAAHMQAVWTSAQAHIALITSQPALYPGGLPVSLDAMRKQLTFANQAVQAAMPVVPAAAPATAPAGS